MRKYLLKHPLFLIYMLVMFFLFLGVALESGWGNLQLMFIYLVSFLVSFFLLISFAKKNNLKGLMSSKINTNEKYVHFFTSSIILMTSAFVVFHFIHLGFVPSVSAWQSLDYNYIVHLRTNVTTFSSIPVLYVSSFILKAVMPFMLLYLLQPGIKQNFGFSLLYQCSILLPCCRKATFSHSFCRSFFSA